MSPFLSFQSWWRGAILLLLAFAAAVPAARAQKQEEGTLARVKMDRPANSQAFEFAGAGKTFGTASAVGSKQAQVKSFAFGGKSSVLAGDGAFHAKSFNNPKAESFRTESYLTKTSQVSQRNSFAQADRAFDTKSVGVREAPAANKSMATREFITPTRPYEWHGKRQDTLDEVYKNNPNLTIDQVRDLLNKGPAGRP